MTDSGIPFAPSQGFDTMSLATIDTYRPAVRPVAPAPEPAPAPAAPAAPTRLRAVTHLDAAAADVRRAGEVLAAALEG